MPEYPAPLQRSGHAIHILVFVAFLVITIGAVWGVQEDYIHLFDTTLRAPEIPHVVSSLKKFKMDYRVASTGADIMVPVSVKSCILLQLSQGRDRQMDLPAWLRFNEKEVVVPEPSPEIFEGYCLHELQNFLERDFIRFECIEGARVEITNPLTKTLMGNKEEPAATVLLLLKTGRDITRNQVQYISHRICTSIERMKPENVCIYDTRGRDLSESQIPPPTP